MTDWGDNDDTAAALAGEDVADVESLDESVGHEVASPYYGSVDEFLREYLRSVYQRGINGRSRVWAARWWEYPEAVIRLEALWRAWEHLRQDPTTGMSVWWRDHADHHMPALMDPDGAFAGASAEADENRCRRGEPLPYDQPPAGLFPDLRANRR